MKLERQKIFFTIVLVIILMTVTLDIWQDWKAGSSIKHFITEIIVCLSVFLGIVILWSNNLFLKKELTIRNTQLSESREEASKWKAENAVLIQGLSSAIDRQFEQWGLSPSEREVAMLLLKGLSLKEIAEIRSVSERTVRQQSINVYQKSSLGGRAELSAFFLEDLLK